MALKCGIVGLPNVGKSTLFVPINAKAKRKLPVLYYRTKPWNNHSSRPRLNKLAKLVNPQNVIPTSIEIVDIGTCKGASKGENTVIIPWKH